LAGGDRQWPFTTKKKGKIFTEVINKERVEVTIQTRENRIRGLLHQRAMLRERKPLGGWFNRSILHNFGMSLVKEHMLIHIILPKKEERC